MRPFLRYTLADAGLTWVEDSLKSGWTLSEAALGAVDLKSGYTYAFLPWSP